MHDSLSEVGLHFSHEESAEQRLSELRRMYEPFVNAIGDHLLVNLPPWVPAERTVDDWQTSAWDHFAELSPERLAEITHIIVDHRKKVVIPHEHQHTHAHDENRERHASEERSQATEAS